ncbi:MAG: PQQ-like beta-propeller repeat protein [Gemmataceae bacterium]|nr:PQQ-like beta-propeller repeat protein [Gemmataceae bacterium]
MLLLLFCAAPPLQDPLPEGAMARLGHARLVMEHGETLRVERDGKSLRLSRDRLGGDAPSRWLRVEDGRDLTPAPDLCRVLADGSRLVARPGKWLVLPPDSDKPRRVAESDSPVLFDGEGKRCARVESEKTENGDWFYRLQLGEWSEGKLSWRQLDRASELELAEVRFLGRDALAWRAMDRGAGGRMRLLDLATGRTESASASAPSALSPDRTLLASKDSASLCFHRFPTDERGRRIACRHDRLQPPRFLPGGRAVAGLGGGRLHLLPVDPARDPRSIKLPDAVDFALFPDGKRVAVETAGGLVRIHDLATGKRLDDLSRYPEFVGVRFVGPSEALAWTARGLLVRWDTRAGRELGRAALPLRGDELERLEVGPGGKHVAAFVRGDPGLIADADTGKVVAKLATDEGWRSAAFHPSGAEAVFVPPVTDELCAVRRLRWHSASARDVPATFTTNGLPRCSPDGRFLLLASTGRAELIELATGKGRWETRLAPLGEAKDAKAAELVSFDRAGRRAVVVHGRSATLLDAFTGEKLASVPECVEDERTRVACAAGRWLSAVSPEGRFRLWDLDGRDAARPVVERQLRCRTVNGIDLEEGRLLTCHADGTCLAWDIAALPRAGEPWDAGAWADLGGERPLGAMRALLQQPARAVPLIAGKLAAVPHPPKGTPGWLASLEADSYKERTAAEAELARHREACEGPMRAAIEGATIETRMRLERVLKPLDGRTSDPAWLRQVRAVEVLERLGTKEARTVLERLSKGAPGAALTEEAKAALGR